MTNAPTSLDLLPTCVTDGTWTLAEFRSAARLAAGLRRRDTRPVRVVPGAAAPRVEGFRAHYTTIGGTIIRHPSAYAKRGWSGMVCVPSSREVVVGADWSPVAAGGVR